MDIAAEPTVSQVNGSEAALRAELLVQLLSAQNELAAQVRDLRSGGAAGDVVSAAEAGLSDLVTLQQRLASGTVTAAALRAEITASVASAASVAQQARVATSSGHTSHEQARSEAQAAVRDFADAYYGRRIFDPYLQFASTEDEEAYRRREEERRQAIEAARAEGTPEGDLRATRLALQQMDDAKAHGADASPDFAPIYGRLQDSERALQAQVEPTQAAEAEAALAPSEPAAANDDVLAALRASGVVLADQTVEGHGVTAVGPDSGQLTRA